MALRFVDSFDHYATGQLARKWQAVQSGSTTISPGGGRNGTQSLHLATSNCGVYKFLGPQPTWIQGVAFTFSALPEFNSGTFFALLDGGHVQCCLVLNPDGTLSVGRGFNDLGVTVLAGATSTQAMAVGTYYYVEWKVTIATSIAAGSCKVRVNGVDWLTATTGESTQTTANATASQVFLGNKSAAISASAGAVDMDDYYCCDGTGSVNNDFLGDVMVRPYYPAGAGATTQWTPVPGANWQNVDEHPPDDDVSYNKTGVAANVDLYALDQIAGTAPTIFGVQWNAQVRKNDASSYVLNRAVRSGTTTFLGSTLLTPNTGYQNYTEVLELNPNTGTAWTKTTFNAMQAGLKLVSAV